MIVHVEEDLLNWGPKWAALKTRLGNKVISEHLAELAKCTVKLDQSLIVALCDRFTSEEVTLVSPDREDVFIISGRPDDVRKRIGL